MFPFELSNILIVLCNLNSLTQYQFMSVFVSYVSYPRNVKTYFIYTKILCIKAEKLILFVKVHNHMKYSYEKALNLIWDS